ncbi:MAG: antitoxin component YwqK of YwqJK toxin-antitoxin module [Crocinitomicaceae bacterium]|jgi:antitoxin component YwqK of YwqJK toxin-antitoxin module
MGYSKKASMTKHALAILILFLTSSSFAQPILKENLTKQISTFWDFNSTQIRSRGKNYQDQQGETDEKHGKWTFYDRAGQIEEVRNYYRDNLHGQVVLFYPNGKKRQEGYFKFGLQDSLYFEWYETDHLKVEGTYNLDQPVGEWKNYYVDGRLKSVEETKGEDNYMWEFYLPDSLHTAIITKGNGEMVSFYTTGKVKEWYNYKNGLRHGLFEESSIYGHVTLKGEFKDGEKDGNWEYFYITGDKEKVSTYKSGVLDGPYKYFYDSGKLNVEGEYKKGLKADQWTWYTNKGTKDMQGSFDDGLQHGDWTFWHSNGEISYKAKFDHEVKTGFWTYFYEDGAKYKEGTFSNDLRNGNWKTWYENSTLLMDGNFLEGKETGEWFNYWDNGVLKNKTSFENGELDGDWESRTPDDVVTSIGKYENNLKVGEWTEYFENGKPKDVVHYKLFKNKTKMDYSILKGHVVMESLLHGHSTSFSGKDYRVTEEGDYKKSKKNGEWIAYHPGGRLPAVVSNYKKGELNGTMKMYGRRGKILQAIDYKDGLKHGKYLIYDDRGKVIKTMRFSEGMQIIEGSNGGGGSFTPG